MAKKGSNVTKYLLLAVLGAGIYIGMTYQDEIDDVLDQRTIEEVQDGLESVSDVLESGADELKEKLKDLQ